MFKGLIDTIIGNLQLSIGNVHIRYEVRQCSEFQVSKTYTTKVKGHSYMLLCSPPLSLYL